MLGMELNFKMKQQTKTIKAWTIANLEGICYGGMSADGDKFKAVFSSKIGADLCKKGSPDFYRGHKVLPCTITYTLPARPKKAAKK